MNARGAAVALAMSAAVALATSAAVARADQPPAPPTAALTLAPGEAPALARRLLGLRYQLDATRLTITDAGGDGAPWIGVVERRGPALWLIGDGFAWRLAGPLARPRLAGPGYTLWVTGRVDGDALTAGRLGVLRRPAGGAAIRR